MRPLGQHLLLELWGCNHHINDPQAVRAAIEAAVKAMQATLLNLHVHAFSPQGVTGVATLAESHLAVHSWPEHGYLAVDVFTCGDPDALGHVLEVLQHAFAPVEVRELTIARGTRASTSEFRPPLQSAVSSGTTTSTNTTDHTDWQR